MSHITKFLSVKCPMSLTSFLWFSDYLKKVKMFCIVEFFLITSISNRITIFGMSVPCTVLVPVRQFSLDLLVTLNHFIICLLMVFQAVVNVISYNIIIIGHDILGRSPCWYINAFNFPGRPVLSMFLIPSEICCSILLIFFLSLNKSAYHFSKHLIGLSIVDGNFSSTWNVLFHFIIIRALDFFGLKATIAHVTVSSKAFNTHLAWT